MGEDASQGFGAACAVASVADVVAAISVAVDADDPRQTPLAWTNAVGLALAGVPLGFVPLVAGAAAGVLRERRRAPFVAR